MAASGSATKVAVAVMTATGASGFSVSYRSLSAPCNSSRGDCTRSGCYDQAKARAESGSELSTSKREMTVAVDEVVMGEVILDRSGDRLNPLAGS
jgi:hypothetical protein